MKCSCVYNSCVVGERSLFGFCGIWQQEISHLSAIPCDVEGNLLTCGLGMWSVFDLKLFWYACVALSVMDIADSSLSYASHKWVSLLSPQAESRCCLKSYWRSRKTDTDSIGVKSSGGRNCRAILFCFVCEFTVMLRYIRTSTVVIVRAPLPKQKWNQW